MPYDIYEGERNIFEVNKPKRNNPYTLSPATEAIILCPFSNFAQQDFERDRL